MEDHYKTLQILESATPDQISDAFKKLAVKYHPDKNRGNAKAEEQFKKVSAAHDVLKDVRKKSEYDQVRRFSGGSSIHGARPRRPGAPGFNFSRRGPAGGPSMEDILREAMGPRFGFGFTHQTPTNRDINLEYKISLEEAYTGKRAKASFNTQSGGHRELAFDIPAGIDTGDRIRLKGEGFHENKNIMPGDIFIHISIKPHARFIRNGQTLSSNVTVNALDAMIGSTITLKNIIGKNISLTVPPGTQPGDQLRLRGQGFKVKGMQVQGDLIVTVEIQIPVALTSKEEALIRQIKELRKKH